MIVESNQISYLGEKGIPFMKADGNSAQRNTGSTGSWRTFKPLIKLDKCIKCDICWISCPDVAISLDKNGYPKINYDVCKGCLICTQVCPVKTIGKERDMHG